MNSSNAELVLALSTLLVACGTDSEPMQHGAEPVLPEPQRGLLPAMNIAGPVAWGDQRPVVPAGYSITPIATDLKVPRLTLVLPNGDILVAEGMGGGAPKLRPKDFIAGLLRSKGTISVESGDRLSLLRDADGDGTYERPTVFAENLNAPYGLALVGNRLYVANQDALVRFDYQPGCRRCRTEHKRPSSKAILAVSPMRVDSRFMLASKSSRISARGLSACH